MRYAIPALILAGLLVLLGIGLRLNPREVPSPLIGKPAPAFDLPTLDGIPPRFTQQNLTGKPVLVNYWASWCSGCQVEHALLMRLAKEENVTIYGFDYKDAADDARNWLVQHGNPYALVIADAQGAAGIDWGVYGVPETFVLDAKGVIVFKQIGPMTEEAWVRIKPLLQGSQGK